MKSVQEQYAELLKLTRDYLLQEYDVKERLPAESATYSYFRDFVMQQQSSAAKPSPPNPPVAISVAAANNPIPVVVSQEKKPQVIPTVSAAEEKRDSPKPMPKPPSLEEAAPVAKAEPKKIGSKFIPEAMPPPEAVDLGDMYKIMSEKCPSLVLTDEVPSDDEAKKQARNWEQELLAQIFILTCENCPKQNQFFANVQVALEVSGYKTKLIKGTGLVNKKWDPLLNSKHVRLIIATSQFMAAFAELKKIFNTSASSIPLLLLRDPASYINEPHHKLVLWQSIKEHLAKSS